MAQAPEPAYQQAAYEAMQAGKLPEALDVMQYAVTENPQNLEYQYTLGDVYVRLGRYDEAELIFQTLLRQDGEQYRKAYFDLAYISMKRGKDAEALEQLQGARLVDAGRADYESGLVYGRLKNYGRAAELFRQARAEKPELAADAAMQEAIALFQMKRYEESRKALESMSAMKLPADRAEEAKKLLAAVDAAERAEKPWHLSALVGAQFDSNLFQNPVSNVAGGVSPTTGQSDWGQLTSLTMRYDLFRCEPWRAGAALNYYNLLYFSHSDLSLVGARPSLYAFWDNKPYLLGVETMYSHYWVGGDNRADVYSIFPVFAYTYADKWRTEVRSNLEYRNYLDQTPDDRLLGVGVMEYYLMQKGLAHIRGGFRVEWDNMIPEGVASFLTSEATVGVQWPIGDTKWVFDIAGYYIHRQFDSDPAFNSQKRRDNEEDLNIMLRGPLPLVPNLQLVFLFQHIWNDSNIVTLGTDPFNYKRAVFTCMLSYEY
jgi:tetratricopeptide (TPR) repeat protein